MTDPDDPESGEDAWRRLGYATGRVNSLVWACDGELLHIGHVDNQKQSKHVITVRVGLPRLPPLARRRRVSR